MLKMKNQSGVTLTALVVTIIVLMIILSISVNLGVDSINSTKDRKLLAEVEMVQQACISEYTKAMQLGYLENASTKPANFVGTAISITDLPSVTGAWFFTAEPAEKYKSYYKLTPEDLESLDILNSEHTYIVNYYTGEVYNETKKYTSEKVPLYIKAKDVSSIQNNNDTQNYVNW